MRLILTFILILPLIAVGQSTQDSNSYLGVYELPVSTIDYKKPLSSFSAKVIVTEAGITFYSDIVTLERRAGTYSPNSAAMGMGDNEFLIDLDKSSRDPDAIMIVIFKTIQERQHITVNINEYGRQKVISLLEAVE
jgi:hypothetical protein